MEAKRAVIYARYSSDSQTEQSIEGQIRVCEDYALKNNIVILDVYIDRAQTGTNDNRAEFQRMLKDSNKKNWDMVLVYKLDRFARNQYEAVNNRRKLENNKVALVSAMENIPDTPEGKLFRSIIEGYNEYYSEDVRQKVKRGMRESRLKGNFTGGTILYGYKVVNHKVVIDEERAEVVRYVYLQYSQGVFAKDIIKELNAKGITYNGKPFARNTIYNMLKNEKYSGVYRHGDEVFTNIYPQIVPQSIFDKVRIKTKKVKYGKHSAEVVYILRNKVRCGYCGDTISGETGTARDGSVKRYYKCFGRKRHNGCSKKMVRKEFLEEFVMDALMECLKSKEYMDRIIKDLMEEQERQARQSSYMALLKKEYRQTQTALNNLVKALENGISSATTNKRLHELETKLEDIEKNIAIEQNKVIYTLTEAQMREFYAMALKLEPKMLITHLIKEIVLYDDHIDIIYNTPTQTSPDDSQGFLFYKKYRNMKYVIQNKPVQLQKMLVRMYI